MENKNIELGMEIRDRVTGFRGIAISRTVFLNGCVQYQIKPKLDKDGKNVEGALFDSQQIEVIGEGIVKTMPKEKKSTGGVMPDTPRFG